MEFLLLKNVSFWLSIPLVFLAWVLALVTVKKIVFGITRKLAARTRTDLDDLLLDALDWPLQLLIYATGVLVVQSLITKVDPNIIKYILGGFKVVLIVAIMLFVDKFMSGAIRLYAQKIDILKTSGGVAHGFIRFVVVALGFLIILDSFGVSVTPIIASLGIGSLAVALALQPTLENFFSGIQLLSDKPIQVGQFIKLESGEEGTVQKIGWRSTWIVMPNNNTVVIPNKLLVNSRVTNYFLPSQEIVVPVNVQVHYRSDLDKVEKVTLDIACQVMKEVNGGVLSFDPALRCNALGASGIDIVVVLRAMDFASGPVVKHEFIKRLHRRYAEEGIVIPYPTQVVIQENIK